MLISFVTCFCCRVLFLSFGGLFEHPGVENQRCGANFDHPRLAKWSPEGARKTIMVEKVLQTREPPKPPPTNLNKHPLDSFIFHYLCRRKGSATLHVTFGDSLKGRPCRGLACVRRTKLSYDAVHGTLRLKPFYFFRNNDSDDLDLSTHVFTEDCFCSAPPV